MNQPQPLAAYFAGWAANRPARLAVAATISALATVSIEIAELVGQGALAGPLGRLTGKKGEVDEQKEIDLLANNRIVDVLRGAPVAAVASEEMDAPLLLDMIGTNAIVHVAGAHHQPQPVQRLVLLL